MEKTQPSQAPNGDDGRAGDHAHNRDAFAPASGRRTYACFGTSAASLPASSTTRDFAFFDIDSVMAFGKAITKDNIIVLVSFQSRFEKNGLPCTLVTGQGSSGKADLHIDGRIDVLKTFAGSAPQGGDVRAAIPVDFQRLDRDAQYQRLVALTGDVGNGEDAQWRVTSPVRDAIGVAEAGTKKLVDFRYFGPIPPGNRDSAGKAVDFLLAHPFGELTRAQAQTMLKDQQPLVVWLGLARIVNLSPQRLAVPADDFCIALKAVPVTYVPSLVQNMFIYGDGLHSSEGSDDWASCFLTTLKTDDAERQIALLKALNTEMEAGSTWLAARLDREKAFLGPLRSLIQDRLDKPEWKEMTKESQKTLLLISRAKSGNSPQRDSP